MNTRMKLLAIAGLLGLALLVQVLPWERQSSGITDILHLWSEQQEETSDKITSAAVQGAEGKWVGEHDIKGANWSIPNIIRHWLGG